MQRKTLQELVNESIARIVPKLSIEPFSVRLKIIPATDDSVSLQEQVIRYSDGEVLVPENYKEHVFPDYTNSDKYAAHRNALLIGSLTGIAVLYKSNHLVKTLIENNRKFEYAFWSNLIKLSIALADTINIVGEKESFKYASRMQNNSRTDKDPASIGIYYAANIFLRHGTKQLQKIVTASSLTEIHDLMPHPRDTLLEFYNQQGARKQ